MDDLPIVYFFEGIQGKLDSKVPIIHLRSRSEREMFKCTACDTQPGAPPRPPRIPQVRNRWHEWGCLSFIEPMSWPYFIFLPSVAAAQALSRGRKWRGGSSVTLTPGECYDFHEFTTAVKYRPTFLAFERRLRCSFLGVICFMLALLCWFSVCPTMIYSRIRQLEMMTWILQGIYLRVLLVVW